MEFVKGDAVRIESGLYGFVSFAKYGIIVFRTWYTEQRVITRSTKVTKCSGCECGNPFTMCHPEA